MKKTIILTVLLTTVLQAAFAGAWLRGEKGGFYKLSQTFLRGDQFYDGEGKSQSIITTGVYMTTLYGEYGLNDRFDVIANVPLFTRMTLNKAVFSSGRVQEGDALNALGDVDLAIKYGIRRNKPLVISTSLTLGLPLGETEGGDTKLLQSGDGEFNQLIRLEAGYAFKKPFYTNLGVGFNNRTENFSDEFRYDFELGYQYKKTVLLAFKMAGVESLRNGDSNLGGNAIFSNNVEYLTFGPELAYIHQEKWGLSFAYRTATNAKFIINSPAYEVGLFLTLK